MKPFSRTLLACLLICLSLLLPGCWDRTEINDIAIVLASAFDLEDDGSIRFSMQMPLPGNLGGPTGGAGGTSGSKASYIDSEDGRTAREAAVKLQRRMARRFFLSHRRVLVVGEDYAKKIGIGSIFDTMPRLPESRLTTYIIIAKGKGYDLLNAQPRFERFSSEAIRELAKAPGALDIKMKDVAAAIAMNGSDPIIPYMTVKENEKGSSPSKEIDVAGFALFRDDKMVGITTPEETPGIAWLKNDIKAISSTVDLGEGRLISYTVKEGSCSIDVKPQGDRLKYSVKIKGNAVLQENQAGYDLAKLGSADETETKMQEQIKSSVLSIVDRIKRQKVDIAFFGNLLWRRYPDLWEKKYRDEWPEPLARADIDVKVDVHFTNYGLIFENLIKEESK